MRMQCKNVDTFKPIDRLQDEKISAFDSGEGRACDKDLDAMIWELGDYENEESPQEARDFEDEPLIEEELIEGKIVKPRKRQQTFRKTGRAGEAVTAGVNLASAHSLSPETRGKKRTPSPARHSNQKNRQSRRIQP
jgi:hypothetical protein